jgi:hypothetical protein
VSDEIFTAFITKYALTSGIEEMQVRHARTCSSMVSKVGARYTTHFHGEGREWHRTRESAVTRAEEMRKRKIASLKKSIEKIEKLEF